MGKHKPMVTKAEFEQVQSIIHRKIHIQPKRHSFSFTGLIRCGGCGCLVTAEKKVKHYKSTNRTVTYKYYRCTRSKPCSEPCVTESDIENQIQNQLNRVTIDHTALDWAEAAIRRMIETRSGAVSQVEENFTKRIAELEVRLNRLLDLRLKEEISPDEFQDAREATQKELNETNSSLERFRVRSLTVSATISNLFGFLRSAGDSFVPAPEKLKREIATHLADSYLLTLRELKVSLHPLLRVFATLEPRKLPKQQVKRTLSAKGNPQMWALVDNIVTLLRETDVAFPHIDFQQQVDKLQISQPESPPLFFE